MTERTRYNFDQLEHRSWFVPMRGVPAPGDLEGVEFDVREEEAR